MKNRIILSSLAAALLLFSACESDRESNPTLTIPDSFVLNTPTLSDGTYDLTTSKSVELSCTQPEYGYTAPVTYSVEASLDSEFTTVETLPTSYTTAKMDVIASEIAVAITNFKLAEGKTEADFPMYTTVNLRLKAELSAGQGTVYSNSVSIDTYSDYSIPVLTQPETMYIIGGLCDWSWDNAFAMVPAYGAADFEFCGTFWRLAYVPEGSGFKVNMATAWDGGQVGFDGATVNDNAEAGISSDGDGNIVVAKGGWYNIVVTIAIEGPKYVYTIDINKPEVYLYGDTSVGSVWESKPENLFTVPADANGDFVSPAFGKGGEIRACVNIPNFDWWKSEFIVLNNKLEYRKNGKDQERATGATGQKIYINFTAGTGKIE